MKSNQAGFTLIELVVVIVILGILAATAMPKLQNIEKDAKTAAVQGALAGLHGASQISYSTVRTASTFHSIWGNTTFTDQLISFSTVTCSTTSGTPTTVNAGYLTDSTTGYLTTLASTIMDNTLCSG